MITKSVNDYFNGNWGEDMEIIKIAIVVVTYNRIKSLERLLLSLSEAYYQADKVDLIISVDKSSSTQVEDFADLFIWEYGNKFVDKHNVNFGLKKHILSLGKWFDHYDALVILEDDLIVSPGYYSYTKQCVKRYKDSMCIAGISLYGFEINYQNQRPFIPIHDGNDVYFMNCAMSWGQVWLKKQWAQFMEWYSCNQVFEKNVNIPVSLFRWGEKSWLKFHTRYCIEENKYFVFPYISYTTNFSEVGVNHSFHNNGNPTLYQVVINEGDAINLRLPELSESFVKYDGFFENKNIAKALGLDSEELCVDLNGEKANALNKKYYLTKKKLDYKIIRSFGLLLRPIEENIFKKIEGFDIYLYDTSLVAKNNSKKDLNEVLYAFKINNFAAFFRMAGLKEIIMSLLESMKYRFRRII